MSREFAVEKGSMPNTSARYELFLPKVDTQCGAVILLHGFQGKLDWHRGTAALLAKRGMACLIVNLLPLMSIHQKVLHELRESNAQATIAYVDWLGKRKEIESGNIILSGFSAGGAVALEAASALIGKVKLRAVLLLDAVPWASTMKKGASASGLCTPQIESLETVLADSSALPILSLRGEPSSWNAYSMILEQLARGMGTSLPSFDILVKFAKHGDFMCSSEADPSAGVTGFMGGLMQCVGLFSNREVRFYIQEIIIAFCDAVLQLKASANLSAMLNDLEKGGVIKTQLVDASLPCKRDLPYFLQ